MENLTDAISINHNWYVFIHSFRFLVRGRRTFLSIDRCNLNNLPSMFSSLLSAVSDVESALSDVQELLQQGSGTQWENEWNDIVQDVLKKDSGWECV